MKADFNLKIEFFFYINVRSGQVVTCRQKLSVTLKKVKLLRFSYLIALTFIIVLIFQFSLHIRYHSDSKPSLQYKMEIISIQFHSI